MLVHLHNFESFVAANARQRLELEEALTTNEYNLRTGAQEQQGFWRPYSYEWIGVPSGLIPYLLKIAGDRGWAVQVEDHRTPPTYQRQYPSAHMTFTPYPDQAGVVEKMFAEQRGVLDLATNTGKTYIAAAFWARVNYSSLLLTVPTKKLLHQTSADLERLSNLLSGSVGRVGDGLIDWKPCTVAIVNSAADWLSKHGSFPFRFETLIVDEAHLQASNRAFDLAQKMPSAFFRFWMSGTPYRDRQPSHVMALTGLAGPCLASISNRFLVESGRSARPTMTFVKINPGKNYDGSPNLQGQYKLLKTMAYRNEVIRHCVEEASRYNLVSVVFVEHKDHLRALSQLMPYADTVYGGTGSRSDQRVHERLVDRTTRCVIATSKWRVGVSLSGIDHLIHAGGFKAAANPIQELGRALRKKEYGGNCCFYTDFMDEWAKYPHRHSQQRWATMVKEGFPIDVIEPSQIGDVFARELNRGT